MTEKKREVTKAEFELLHNLEIQLKHDVPEQHKIGKIPSVALTPEEVKEFNKYCPLRRGKYLQKEHDIFMKNWKDFCEIHNWDPNFSQPFADMEYEERKFYIHKLKNRIKFYQFIANGLPGRSLNSIYKHFRFVFGNVRLKPFSCDEDTIIMKQMSELKTDDNDQKFIKIGEMLGRQPKLIAKRYDVLITSHPSFDCRVQSRRVIWDLKLMTEFLKHLLEFTLSNDVMQLKNAQIPKYVFKKIEERMNISMLDLEKQWWIHMHLQLFSPKRIFINDLKIRLIKLMMKLGPKNIELMPYKYISRYIVGITPVFVKQFSMNILRHPKTKPVGDIADRLEYLCMHSVPTFKLNNENSYKCRLQYHKGKIRLHPDDETDADSADEINLDSSDMDVSVEDDYEDAAMSANVSAPQTGSTPIDARLGEELDSDRSSLNFNERTNVENENTTQGESLISTMKMWNDVVNGQIIDIENLEKANANIQFCSNFISNLIDLTLSSSVEKLKNATIPDVVWKKLETRLNIPSDQLKDYWLLQLHMQLFCPKHIFLNEIKSQIIELLYDLKLSTFADIEWSTLVYCFDGTTPEFLQHVFDSVLVSINEKDIKTKSFTFILKQLYINEIKELLKATGDKRLKRFHYKIEKIRLVQV